MIRLSNALPVQWWINGQPVYNEKILNEPGIDRKYFFQIFNSSDPINTQFMVDEGEAANHYLRIYDEDSNLLATLPFVSVAVNVYYLSFVPEDLDITNDCVKLKIVTLTFENGDFENSLLPWTNEAPGDEDWTWGNVLFDESYATVTLAGSIGTPSPVSKRLRHEYSSGVPAQVNFNYKFRYTTNTAPSDVKLFAVYRKLGVETAVQEILVDPAPDVTIEGTFLTDESDFDEIEFYVGAGIGVDPDTFATFFIMTFQPEVNVDNVLAYSDILHIKEAHSKSILLQYSNVVNYAGIVYAGLDETPFFAYRIKAKFFKERDPEENESVPQSDGSIAKLLGTVKNQKKLQVEPSPFYNHRKIKLILQHQSLYADNYAWVKEENYETEDYDEHDPFYKGETFLTQKNNSFVANPFG